MSKDAAAEPKDEGELLQWAKQTQRSIEFIINQHAQFSADLQRMQEQNEERWARADERWTRTAEGISALLAIAEIHEREIGELRQTQAEAQAEARARQARVDAQMAETGERLNALINTVERVIS
ncbi:MAG TPA: hypothetical protein VE713_00020, partial [Pyrinomonadaceae bacterium]|nr:hypothetical protein [Pyrinomonadaceae bacterium]